MSDVVAFPGAKKKEDPYADAPKEHRPYCAFGVFEDTMSTAVVGYNIVEGKEKETFRAVVNAVFPSIPGMLCGVLLGPKSTGLVAKKVSHD